MKIFTLVAALAVAVPAVLAQQLTIETPSGVGECQPTKLNVLGGVAPYILNVLPGSSVYATPVYSFTTNSTSYTWDTNVTAGAQITFSVKDSTGALAYSSPVIVQATGSTCSVTSLPPYSSTASSGASPTSGSGSSGAGSTTAANSGSSSSPTTSASGSSGTSAPTSSNGAGRLSVSSTLGVAGIMGLAAALL